MARHDKIDLTPGLIRIRLTDSDASVMLEGYKYQINNIFSCFTKKTSRLYFRARHCFHPGHCVRALKYRPTTIRSRIYKTACISLESKVQFVSSSLFLDETCKNILQQFIHFFLQLSSKFNYMHNILTISYILQNANNVIQLRRCSIYLIIYKIMHKNLIQKYNATIHMWENFPTTAAVLYFFN